MKPYIGFGDAGFKYIFYRRVDKLHTKITTMIELEEDDYIMHLVYQHTTSNLVIFIKRQL